jgi:cytochrome P450
MTPALAILSGGRRSCDGRHCSLVSKRGEIDVGGAGLGEAMSAVVVEHVVGLLPMTRRTPLDPPENYAALREGPLRQVRTPRGDVAWLVTRYEDVRSVLTDRRFSSDPRAAGYPSYIAGSVPPPPGFFMQMDAPDHGRLRGLVSREFLNVHVERLRPRMEQVIDSVLDDMLAANNRPVDLVGALAYPVAARIIGELLGMPYDDRRFVQETTDAVLDRSRSPAETEAAAIELMSYFGRVVDGKAASPVDDLVGRLLADQAADGRASREEIVGVTALLFLGGYDTMAQIIGLGTIVLLRHPAQLAAFLDEPSRGDTLVDELVRYLSVNHAGLPRAVTDEVAVSGQTLRAGEGVLVMINAANRDRAAFERPDLIDLDQPSRHHLGFGHGLHKCIGAQFARTELQLVFRKLFQRAPGLRTAVPIEELRFRDEMVLYGVQSLPVTW